MVTYYDWMKSSITCPSCGWTGCGEATDIGDTFDAGSERHCPTCGHYFGFKGDPTQQEVMEDPRADDAGKLAARVIQERRERFDRAKLKAPHQLPNKSLHSGVITWDVVEAPDGQSYVVLSDGAKEIWRELSWYENYARFEEVAAILKRKYGRELHDIQPTLRSELDLYGDRFSAPEFVEKIRAGLRRKLWSALTASLFRLIRR